MTDDDRRELLAEKARIAAEIRIYPMPIPACDAQYNHLIERRAEIERVLAHAASPSPDA